MGELQKIPIKNDSTCLSWRMIMKFTSIIVFQIINL